MAIENSGTVRPQSPSEFFRFQPYYRGDNVEQGVASKTKGTDIMLQMLLDQYQNKPILRQYFQAFFDEMDWLFESLDNVYLGRFLDQAVGIQLDILGAIINQGRDVELPDLEFGFVGATNATKMADEATPADGGIFRDESSVGFTKTPLSDTVYRRLLRAKAQLHNRHDCSINNIYHATTTLLGKTPRRMEIVSLGVRQLTLKIAIEDTTASDAALLFYMSKYMAPLGTSLTITREVTP